MLRNEVYIGNTVQNKVSVVSYKVKKLRKVEKEKYINNLKNKHKYEYIEETIKNTSPKSDINDIIGEVFDIEKVEIE